MNPEHIAELAELKSRIETEVRETVVGQEQVLSEIMIALIAGGHALLVGVPGLAKTRLIKTVAGSLGLQFRRIQFTPDLMPSDVTGMEVLEEEVGSGRRSTRFVQGPVFTNMLLADEINRTPPRTQAALLEAMQERQVTIGRRTYKLEDPFFVLATQNPIEQEGTYPLPEAQLDRFMLQIQVPYPQLGEELAIALMDPVIEPAPAKAVITPEQLLGKRDLVRGIVVAEAIAAYAVSLVRASRPADPSCPHNLKSQIAWGAGPRASQYLILSARVRAALNGRMYVAVDDIRDSAYGVLQHRILPSYVAESEGVSSSELVRRLLDAIPAPA